MKLIYDSSFSGHHSVYIKYLILFIIEHNEEKANNLFVLNKKIRDHLDIPTLDKINIRYIEDSVMEKFTHAKMNLFKSFMELKYIKKLIQENPDIKEVLFMNLDYMQIALMATKFVRSRKINISGILFNGYNLYAEIPGSREKAGLGSLRLRKNIQLKLLIFLNKIKMIYLLNDEKGAILSNKRFKKDIFGYLPDPVSRDSTVDYETKFFNKLKINKQNFKLLIYGSIERRKNIPNILRAITNLDIRILQKITILIMGECQDAEYYKLIQETLEGLRESFNDTQIIFYNQFLSLRDTNTLFSISDLILMPYLSFYGSSNILGHATAYKKFVIGPNYGLISQLIRDYNLGSVVDPKDTTGIANLITEYYKNPSKEYPDNNFITEHSSELFASKLLID